MLRQGLFALVMLVLCIAFVSADTLKGRIVKIDEKGVSVATDKADKDGKAYPFAKDAKFFKAVGKDDKEEIKEGAKADAFQKLGKNGLAATVTTNDKGEVTEVVLTAKKKKTN